MKNIKIPDNVTVIETGAFEGCSGLMNAIITQKIEETCIGDSEGLHLAKGKESEKPSLKHVADALFRDCSSIKSVTLPESISTIGIEAFKGCSCLQKINIPQNVKWIGNMAFMDCIELKSIDVPEDAKIEAGAFANCKQFADKAGFVVMRGVLHSYCGKEETMRIPDSVKEIYEMAFNKSASVKNIILPAGIQEISNKAFRKCRNLENIWISDSVTFIVNDAFLKPEKLTIHATEGSYAQVYAQLHGIQFEKV